VGITALFPINRQRPLGRLLGAVLVAALAAAGSPPLAMARSREAASPDSAQRLQVASPAPQPILGERLSFHGHWLGLPIGSGWLEVKEIVEVDGRRAYHIQAEGHTNDVLSALYPIHDSFHSYLDVETLKPLRFEKHQREGRYRADEMVTFDHAAKRATYRSLLNHSVKEIELPEEFQDLISALYWFRAQPLDANQPLAVNLYTDEKIYRTEIRFQGPQILELLKRGTFPCLVVEPKASFKGILVKRGRIWAYFTTDARRVPLLARATTPWGPMSAVLDETALQAALLGAQKSPSSQAP